MKFFDFKIEEATSGRTVYLYGTLDKNTYTAYETQILQTTEGVSALTLDLSELVNISSAGLRLLLKMHLEMEQKEGMTVRGVSEFVQEIFEITGFSSFLNIEK